MRQSPLQKSPRLSRALRTPVVAPKHGRPQRIICYWDASELSFELLDAAGAVMETRRVAAPAVSTEIPRQLDESLEPWNRRYGKLPVTLAGLPVALDGNWNVKPSKCPINIADIPDTVVRLGSDDREISLIPGLTCSTPVGSPDYLFGEETALLGASKLFPGLVRRSKLVCIPGEITRWIVLRHGHILFFTSSIPCSIFRMLKSDPLFQAGAGSPIINAEVFSRGAAKAEETASTDLIHLLLQVRNRKLKAQLAASDMASYLLGMLIGRDVSEAVELLQLRRLRAHMVLLADSSLGSLYENALAAQGLRATRIDLAPAISLGLSQVNP